MVHRVVCLSSQRWDDGMWTNKQHIMQRLAEKHEVYHVDFGSMGVTRSFKQRAGRGLGERLRFWDPVVEKRGRVNVVSVFAPRYVSWSATHSMNYLTEFDLRVLCERHFMQQRGIDDAIVWVYHPGYGLSPTWLPRKLLVYDCVDEYAQFPEYRNDSRTLTKREAKLCAKADLVFATSRPLYERKRGLNPKATHLVHNVGDAPHFKQAMSDDLKIPADIAAIQPPVIGFIGALSGYKVNLPWLVRLAKSRPDWSLVLIGPVGLSDPSTDVAALRGLSNVHILGHRDYASLPAYVKGFDVNVIPYCLNEYTEYVFPIKFFELLATGKPLVTSRLPSLVDYAEDVLIADDAAEFVLQCERAIADPLLGQERRVQLATENDWDSRVAKLMAHVERKLS
ncbi:MAG: glycosyltransferase [Polyangiaceae bacterium]